jgi:hypothetical protein
VQGMVFISVIRRFSDSLKFKKSIYFKTQDVVRLGHDSRRGCAMEEDNMSGSGAR